MKKGTRRFMVMLFAFSVISFFAPSSTLANQPESPVAFVEGQEPLQIGYGEYTTGARIEDPTDTDCFNFVGTAGDDIRVMISRSSGYFYPCLEIWDPNGDKVVDYSNSPDVRVDKTLSLSGKYVMVVSDRLQDYDGDYTLALEKIPPVSDPPLMTYDTPFSDRIDHSADIDFFVIQGNEGAYVRFMVSRTSGYFSPRLEVWDPNGDKVVDYSNSPDVLVDETLSLSGKYVMVVSDRLQDYDGDFKIEVQCIAGNCPNSPQLSIQTILNQNIFCAGDTLIIFAHIMNGPERANVEVKLWIDLPSTGQMSIIEPCFTFTVEPSADFTAKIFEYTFSGHEPPGDYAVGGRFLNPISGRNLSGKVEFFTFSP
jgi:hypothetical protein